MRYAYVKPVVPDVRAERVGEIRRQAVVLQRAITVDVNDPVVPMAVRSLVLAGREARPDWVFRITRSVTLNEAGNALVHHVFIRVYGKDGEPLGHCGWTAGHTTGAHARIWNAHPERKIPFAFVNATEFACWVRGIPYVPPAVADRGDCTRCTATDIRIKKDGTPYKHKDPLIGMECT